MHVTVLSRKLGIYTTRRLAQAARMRGARVRVLDPLGVEMHLEEQEAAKQESSSPPQETGVKATSNGKRDESDGFADGSSSALNVAAGYINVTGNLCPQCGCNTMVREEGCRKCYTCGHSEC